MGLDPFEHVRSLYGQVRRAAAAGRMEEARQYGVMAFGAIHALGATGALSDEDQQQLMSEMVALEAEYPKADEEEGESEAGSPIAMATASLRFATLHATAETDPSPALSSSRRLRTIALDPVDATINGDVPFDLVALHFYDDRCELDVRLHLGEQQFGMWSHGERADLDAALDELRARDLPEDEMIATFQEWMSERHRTRDQSAGQERMRAWHQRVTFDVAVTDDVGTRYRTDPAGGGGDGTTYDARQRVTPSPPAEATRVTLAVHGADGRPTFTREVPLA